MIPIIESIRLLCTIVCVVSATSVVGYLTDSPHLYHWTKTGMGMAFNTALCFLCLAVAMMLGTLEKRCKANGS